MNALNRASQWLVLVAFLEMTAGAVHAAKATLVEDIDGIALTGPDYRPLSAAEVRTAITGAATALGWTITEVGDEVIRLRLARSSDRASFWVDIELPYGDGRFGIRYVDSDGLRYREGGGRRAIHGSYGRWISNLLQAIRKGGEGLRPTEEKLD